MKKMTMTWVCVPVFKMYVRKKNIRTLDCSFFSLLLLLLLVFVGGRIVVVFVWNFFLYGENKIWTFFFWPSNIAGFLLHELRRKLIKVDHKIDRLIDCDFVYINLIESQSSDYYYYHRSIINIDIRHWEMSMCHIYWIECMSKILLKLWTHDDDDDDDEIIYLFVEIWSVDSVCFLLISINFLKK